MRCVVQPLRDASSSVLPAAPLRSQPYDDDVARPTVSPSGGAGPAADLEAELASGLLTLDDVGLAGFEALPYARGDAHSPCSDRSIDESVPPDLLVGASFTHEVTAIDVLERIATYRSAQVADEAWEVIDGAFACGGREDEPDRRTVRDQDVSVVVGVDPGSTAHLWVVRADDGTRLSCLAILSGPRLVTVTTFVPAGSDGSALPGILELGGLALAKVTQG